MPLAPAPTSTPSPCNFSDVDHTDVSSNPNRPHYFSQAIYTLCPSVVVGDTGNLFDPYRAVSRGEYSQITAKLWNYIIPGSPPSGCDFSDISTSVFKGAIWAVCQHHIVSGYDATTCANRGLGFPCFGPTDTIRHDQMVKLITLAAGVLSNPSSTAPHYSDAPSSGFWGYIYVESLYNAGIIGNAGYQYVPTASLLRGDAVFYNFNSKNYYSHLPYYYGHGWARIYPNTEITGISARKTVPHGNDNDTSTTFGHWAAGPIAVGDESTQTYIESGPGSNLSNSQAYRSYESDSAGGYTLGSVNLVSEMAYTYHSSVDTAFSTSWSAYACDPVCSKLADVNIGIYHGDRVNSSAETSIKPESLGQTDTDTNVYTTTNSTTVGWCYNWIFNDDGATYGGTCNYPAYAWYQKWTHPYP